MKDNFNFEEKPSNKYRKLFQKIYPVYSNIKDELLDLQSCMSNIEKKYKNVEVIEEYDLNGENFSEKINLTRDIIYFYLGKDYLDKFDKLVYEDKIKFYDADSDYYVIQKYDNYEGYFYDSITNQIYAPLENELNDINSIIHEFIHYWNNQEQLENYTYSMNINNQIISQEFLSEFPSFFFELLTLEYLKEHTNNDLSIYNFYNERIAANKYMFQNFDEYDSDLDSVFGIFTYQIAYLLSTYMYQKYLINPDKILAMMVNYNNKFDYIDFNQSMKLLGINIRYVDGKLRYSNGMKQELLDSYKKYVHMINNRDFNTSEKVKKFKLK